MSVRKWTTTLTLAGLGAMLLTSGGRKLIRSAAKAGGGRGRLAAWNDSAREELNHIQQAVKDVEQLMGTHTAQ
jgi:hypothetical protein